MEQKRHVSSRFSAWSPKYELYSESAVLDSEMTLSQSTTAAAVSLLTFYFIRANHIKNNDFAVGHNSMWFPWEINLALERIWESIRGSLHTAAKDIWVLCIIAFVIIVIWDVLNAPHDDIIGTAVLGAILTLPLFEVRLQITQISVFPSFANIFIFAKLHSIKQKCSIWDRAKGFQ